MKQKFANSTGTGLRHAGHRLKTTCGGCDSWALWTSKAIDSRQFCPPICKTPRWISEDSPVGVRPTDDFVAGPPPPGGGKSSALSIKELGIDWFNADDRAAELNGGSYHKISPAIRDVVGRELEEFILGHIDARRDVAFETTLRSAITFEQTKFAHQNGFRVTMVYVAAGPVEEHIRRVANRADLGQHSASESKIRDIYERSMRNLVTAFHENREHRIEFLRIFDNAGLWQPPRVILEMRLGEPRYLDQEIPEWLDNALRISDFNILALRRAFLAKGQGR